MVSRRLGTYEVLLENYKGNWSYGVEVSLLR